MGVTASTGVLLSDEMISMLLISVVVLFLVYVIYRKPTGIPPGPSYTLPFIGDLPLLTDGGILGTFRKLRQKHGDIFSIYLGRDLNIVLNGYQVIHEAAVKHGNVFSGRPSVLANEATGGKEGINMAEGNL